MCAAALAYDAAGKRWLNLRANAVVLACGGYCGIYPVSTNKRDSGGDGVAMAYEAGAELCDMEFIQFEPSAAVWPRELVGTSVITTLLFEGAVLRNRDGERFMLRYGPEGDRVSKDVMSRRIVAEIARGKGTEHGGIYMDITGVDPARLASGYQMYVQRYRNVGIDITKEWIELAPAPHTALGGVRVDAQGHSTVQGLFACGEVMGGLHGANRIGGNAGLETLVFGRRAGRAAGGLARSAGPCNVAPEPAPQLAEESCSSKIAALRRGMREALWDGVNAVRDAQGLQKAINVFSDGLEAVSALRGVDAQESFELLRLKNDMIAAHLTALSALTRADSLGCHARSDYPQEGPSARIACSGTHGWRGAALRLRRRTLNREKGLCDQEPLCRLGHADGRGGGADRIARRNGGGKRHGHEPERGFADRVGLSRARGRYQERPDDRPGCGRTERRWKRPLQPRRSGWPPAAGIAGAYTAAWTSCLWAAVVVPRYFLCPANMPSRERAGPLTGEWTSSCSRRT